MRTSICGMLFPWVCLTAASGCIAGQSASPPALLQRPTPASLLERRAPPAVPVQKGFQTFLRLEWHPQNALAPRDLLPHEAMHSGDRFRVFTWASEPVYVYLVSYDAQGWSSLEFPAGRDVKLAANAAVAVPEHGGLFKLNHQVGDAELIVFASRFPMDEKSASALRLPWPLFPAGALRGGDSEQKKDPPPPPPGRTVRDRDGAWVVDPVKRVVRVDSDAQSQVVLRFPYQHLP